MSDNFGLPSKEALPTSELRPRYYRADRIRATSDFASGPELRDPTGIGGSTRRPSSLFRVQTMEGQMKPSATNFSSSADEHEHAQPLKGECPVTARPSLHQKY